MSEATPPIQRKPILEFLKLPTDGKPYLEGSRCTACGAVYLGSRVACSKCFSRDKLEAAKLSRTGQVYTYSIVHQSFPGIETPYISVIVDLDGGGTVKANLLEVEPDPAQIPFRMPVQLTTFVVPRKDAEGNEYVAFGFRPAKSKASGARSR